MIERLNREIRRHPGWLAAFPMAIRRSCWPRAKVWHRPAPNGATKKHMNMKHLETGCLRYFLCQLTSPFQRLQTNLRINLDLPRSPIACEFRFIVLIYPDMHYAGCVAKNFALSLLHIRKGMIPDEIAGRKLHLFHVQSQQCLFHF